MIKLYGHDISGNSHKVKLFLSLLGVDYEYVQVDLLKGEHKSPEFLKLNPFGQVPVITDGEKVYQDSQAILVYLARAYGGEKWLPNDAHSLAHIVRWLSITAKEIAIGIATARLYYIFKSQTIDIKAATEKAVSLLKYLEEHLSQREWLELGHPTIADIAVYPYIAVAPDAKISLDEYPHVQAWLKRLEELPNFISMKVQKA